jgi:sodium/potassium/calcium exchanger 6|eukprot:g5414.t1
MVSRRDALTFAFLSTLCILIAHTPFASASLPLQEAKYAAVANSPSPSSGGDSGGDDAPDNCTLYHSTCQLVKQNCMSLSSGDQNLIPYYYIHYCVFESVPALSYVLLFVWLMITLSLLGTTADNYFVVQLETLSGILKLSPSTAGITLLALGNSAPDTFTDIAAVQGKKFNLALTELLGASTFLTTIVFGAVILVSTRKPKDNKADSHSHIPVVDGRFVCRVEKSSFIRDVSVFFGALVLLLFFTASGGTFSTFESLIILSIYIAYVIGVIVFTSTSLRDKCCKRHGDAGGASGSNYNALESQQSNINSVGAVEHGADADGIHVDEEHDGECLCGIDWDEEELDSLFDKIFFVLEYPFSWLRWLSIPSASLHWNRRRRILASLAPLGTVCIVFLDFSQNWTNGTPYDGFSYPIADGTNFPMIAVPLLMAAALGLFIYFASDDTTLPKWHMLLVGLAFLSTVAWLDLIGNEIVALLSVLGHMTGATDTQAGSNLVGITVLAWANSIGDFVADTAVAKAGSPRMGISSVFGSPLLTCCFGIGIATLIASSTSPEGTIETNIKSTLVEICVSFGFLALSLFMSFAVVTYNNFVVPRNYAYVLFAFYAVFMVINSMETVGVITFG